ncbi:MAG: MlaD family protein [Acidobacteriaceae bacterium]
MNRNLAVGIFVLVGLTLFMTGLVLIGNRHEAFGNHLTLYTDFADLSGLTKGSKVQVGGMDAGRIEEIGIPNSPSSKFRVKFQLDEKFRGLVRRNSTAIITTAGVVGDTFLSISPGTVTSPTAASGSTLGSKEPTELTDLINQAKGTLGDADTALRHADGLLTSVGGNLNSTLVAARGTVTDVDDIVVGLKRGNGTAGMLLQDRQLANSIRQTISNTEQVTTSLRATANQANLLVNDIGSRKFPQKIDDTLVSVRDAAANIDSTSVGVHQTVTDLTQPDEHGVAVGTNLRETISNMNAATGNLAEDSEALKRNFLVRGFFRKRGYYTLTAVSPAEYRSDSFFASSGHQRIWLGAELLFKRNTNDEEDLSEVGKKAIDEALAPYGDAIVDSPIMVEGYSTDGATIERIQLSSLRANAVRNYIRERFHLDPISIGAVGLADEAPKGARRTTWNGISIVLLAKDH